MPRETLRKIQPLAKSALNNISNQGRKQASKQGALALICSAVLLTALTATLATRAADSTLTANKELASIVERLNALKTWFNDAEKKRAEFQQEIQAADKEVARLGRKVAELKVAVIAIEAEQSALQAESDALEVRRKEEGVRISEHLNAAYRMSGQDFFKLLLNQENPEQFDRMIRYHQYFSSARGKILEGYRKTLTAIEANRVEIDATEQKLLAQRAAASEEQNQFASRLTERKQMLAGLENETRSNEAQRKRLLRDRSRLQELLQELANRAEKNDGKEFASSKGALPWPVSGAVVSSYGQSRADGRLRWQGAYIGTEPGAQVRAVHRGRVVFAEWLRGFGLLTIVDHGGNYMSLYGYADVLLKQPGDRVESGEQIANSGRSGGQDQDGLYFEIRQAGKPVDPALWLDEKLETSE